MSVEIDLYVGYTVELPYEDVGYEFLEKYPEYDRTVSKVRVVEDGMNGDWARIIYIDKHSRDVDCGDEDDYTVLPSRGPVPNEVYEELNKCYKLIYNKDLNENKVQYALWYHWY